MHSSWVEQGLRPLAGSLEDSRCLGHVGCKNQARPKDPTHQNCGQNLLEKHPQRRGGPEGPGREKAGASTRPPQPPGYLLLPSAVVIHAVLGCHGGGGVQGGGIEGHALHVGNVAGEIAQARAVRLVWVPPVLEELFEQRGLAALGKDRDLAGTEEEKVVAGPGSPEHRGHPAGVLQGTSDAPSTPPTQPLHPAGPTLTVPPGSLPHLGLPGVVHLGDEVGGCLEGGLPLLGVGLPACRPKVSKEPAVSAAPQCLALQGKQKANLPPFRS